MWVVFNIVLLRRDLRMGEFQLLGGCIGVAFSYAIVQFTHNKWAMWVHSFLL